MQNLGQTLESLEVANRTKASIAIEFFKYQSILQISVFLSRLKEMKMNAIIKEVALYVFFVTCLCIVSYSHRDPTSFAFRQTMYNTFVEGVYGGKKSFSAVSTFTLHYATWRVWTVCFFGDEISMTKMLLVQVI